MTTIEIPPLNEGEHYAGLILDKAGTPTHHLVLLLSEADAADWDTQVVWAASVGGVLPEPCELSLLMANCWDLFQPGRYWSGRKSIASPGHVWVKSFSIGFHGYVAHDDMYRARAIRRVPITMKGKQK
jgi:hypothetical protein